MAENKSTKADIPHLALPLRYMGGQPIVNEQDSWDDVYDCVQAIVRYPKGFREDLPGFGTARLELTVPGANEALFKDDIQEWEPRTALYSDSFMDLNEMAEHILIDVTDPSV